MINRILVIEDDDKILALLKKGLGDAGFTVDTAADGQEGLDSAASTPFDLLIVDIMLPRLDGLTLVKELRARKNRTPVLFLSAKRAVDDRVAGLEVGGDDYLTKPFAFSELTARIHAIGRRIAGAPEQTQLDVGSLHMDLIKRTVTRDGLPIDLQPREFQLLDFLMRNAGRVVSKTMIMQGAWDYNFDPETNVVEARVCRLREKIEKESAPKLIHTIRGVGYVLREAPVEQHA
jgi:two-component system, OmpR family, response regulator